MVHDGGEAVVLNGTNRTICNLDILLRSDHRITHAFAMPKSVLLILAPIATLSAFQPPASIDHLNEELNNPSEPKDDE